MNTALLVIVSIVGLFALYWVLFGQAKHNAMMQQGTDQYGNIQEKLRDRTELEKGGREEIKNKRLLQRKKK